MTEQDQHHLDPPTEPWVCAECGRVLDHKTGVGFMHTVGDLNAGHKAVPIPQSEAQVVIGRCDFCYEDYPAWVVPAREFEVLSGHVSTGDWAACETCAALIEGNRWSALVRRAQEGWESRHQQQMPEGLAASLPRLYRLLRKNITGSLKPNPAVAQAARDSAKYGTGFKTQPRD